MSVLFSVIVLQWITSADHSRQSTPDFGQYVLKHPGTGSPARRRSAPGLFDMTQNNGAVEESVTEMASPQRPQSIHTNPEWNHIDEEVTVGSSKGTLSIKDRFSESGDMKEEDRGSFGFRPGLGSLG
jgi:hypothetical protein